MAEPTYEELKARLADLEKKGAGRRTGELDFKVGEKGGVSVYGLGRFPVCPKRVRALRAVAIALALARRRLGACFEQRHAQPFPGLSQNRTRDHSVFEFFQSF